MATFSTRFARTLSLACLPLIGASACADLPEDEALEGRADALSEAAQEAQARGKGRYLVTLHDDGSDPEGLADELTRGNGGRKRHVFKKALKGFAVENLPEAAIAALMRNPHVRNVEPDVLSEAEATQLNPGWALDRMDYVHATDNKFNWYFEGAGTHLYILDTGIRGSHSEFTGRIGNGVNVADGSMPTTDTDGHGTGTASVAAGSTFGIARKATIHPVKITSGSTAYESDMVEAIEWVIANKQQPAVMNMSFKSTTEAVAEAMEAAAQAGIVVTKSAGNSDIDACTYPIANVPSILVVGGTAANDELYFDSNWGPCVDIFAPGEGVDFAGITSDMARANGNGTSFAAPYVAGIAAVLRGQTPSLTADQTRAFILNSAYRNKLKDENGASGLPAGSPNLLANSLHTSVMWTGPQQIQADMTDTVSYSYSSRTYGGTGSYSYVWEKSNNNLTFTKIGSSSGVTLSIPPTSSTYYIYLRLTISSGQQSASMTKQIKVMSGVCTNPKICL